MPLIPKGTPQGTAGPTGKPHRRTLAPSLVITTDSGFAPVPSGNTGVTPDGRFGPVGGDWLRTGLHPPRGSTPAAFRPWVRRTTPRHQP
jgi:hypothetical protein